MQTKATIEQARSPVPGVIPEPVRVEHEAADPPPAPHRRPLSRAWARWLSALHGDKYLVPTDPPSWEPAPTVTSGIAGSDKPAAAAPGMRDES